LEEWVGVLGLESIGPAPGEIRHQPPAYPPEVSGILAITECEGSEWRARVLELHASLHLSLFRYLRSLGLSADEAEDVLQEAFLRLAGHLKQRRCEDNLRSWLFQVAHNLSMDVHRASRRERQDDPGAFRGTSAEPVDPGANPERIYMQKEQARQVMTAMSQLTPRQRNSVMLRAEGLRYREIAVVLGVSEQRALHLVKRALLRLTEGM
jgi:RNA polymerase sigma-70 factor (ECF subfamily)